MNLNGIFFGVELLGEIPEPVGVLYLSAVKVFSFWLPSGKDVTDTFPFADAQAGNGMATDVGEVIGLGSHSHCFPIKDCGEIDPLF